MASVTKTLPANTGVTVLIEDSGKEYARIVGGNLDGNNPSNIPAPADYYGKYKYNTQITFTLNDSDILTDLDGVAYWGVESKRR